MKLKTYHFNIMCKQYASVRADFNVVVSLSLFLSFSLAVCYLSSSLGRLMPSVSEGFPRLCGSRLGHLLELKVDSLSHWDDSPLPITHSAGSELKARRFMNLILFF